MQVLAANDTEVWVNWFVGTLSTTKHYVFDDEGLLTNATYYLHQPLSPFDLFGLDIIDDTESTEQPEQRQKNETEAQNETKPEKPGQ